ncbi:MAG: four helix bundle protein [Candidatus Saganbacteria bacterium]|nr:four helix bundle protein [Candidatus Saganbacteria bacterium]
MEERNAAGGRDARFVVRAAKGVIKSYEDLDVYINSYKAMLMVFRNILPLLPKEEKYDLVDQLRRSSKAIPRLIAEGYSKRHQVRGFQKYLDDAHAESNETLVSLKQAGDLYLYGCKPDGFTELLDLYDKISRQLFNLAEAWTNRSKHA